MLQQSLSALPSKYLPPVHRDLNLTSLDRSLFTKHISLVAVYFPDSKCLQHFGKHHRSDLLNLRAVSNIAKHPTEPDTKNKVVLLNDQVQSTDLAQISTQESPNLAPETIKYLQTNNAELIPYQLTLTYDFWRADEILEAILPSNRLNEVPSSFTAVGHIAHLNLKDEYLPYKHIIGQVILDKNSKKIRLVVNKINTIATKFRTFPMEVLAGDDSQGESSFDVVQTELNCQFKFNFRDVYWNSRLQAEHLRLVSQYFKKGELVCDVMAGVGPFAVPAGKKKTVVLANDLNPSSFKYLTENAKLNKVEDFVKCYNLDGAEMIRKAPLLLMQVVEQHPEGQIVVKANPNKKRRVSSKDKKAAGAAATTGDNGTTDAKAPTTETNPAVSNEIIKIPKYINHFVMNLPDSALLFLDNYVGIFGNNPEYQKFIEQEIANGEFKLPFIHVYCFEKFAPQEQPPPTTEVLQKRVQQRIEKIMQYQFADNVLLFHLVRKVSPTKIMFCVSFELPKELAFKKTVSEDAEKKQ